MRINKYELLGSVYMKYKHKYNDFGINIRIVVLSVRSDKEMHKGV